jgi:hypothetical protein
VVVILRSADDIGVLAAGEVDPFDGADSGEGIEGPKDRRPSDPELAGGSVGDEVGRGEVTGPPGDERGDPATRFGHPKARRGDGVDDGTGIHGPRIAPPAVIDTGSRLARVAGGRG